MPFAETQDKRAYVLASTSLVGGQVKIAFRPNRAYSDDRERLKSWTFDRHNGIRGSDSNGAKSHVKRRFPDSLGVGDLALDPRSRIGTYRRD